MKKHMLTIIGGCVAFALAGVAGAAEPLHSPKGESLKKNDTRAPVELVSNCIKECTPQVHSPKGESLLANCCIGPKNDQTGVSGYYSGNAKSPFSPIRRDAGSQAK